MQRPPPAIGSIAKNCLTQDCKNKPTWQEIWLVFPDVGEPIPDIQAPGLIACDTGFCTPCKNNILFKDLLSDHIFQQVSDSMVRRGFKAPKKDWIAFMFIEIPDNVTSLGPRLVRSPEPMPEIPA